MENTGEQKILLENRGRADLTNVLGVDRYDEETIELSSSLGRITIEGEGMRIETFSVESGKLTVVGKIGGLWYDDEPTTSKGGLFGRMKR